MTKKEPTLNLAILGPLISHGTRGYGFKISFLDIQQARHFKRQIHTLLEAQDMTVNSRHGYHGE